MILSPLINALQAADTVVWVQGRDGLATAAAFADVALAVVFALILVALMLLLFQLRGIHGTVRELTGRLEKRLDPMLDRGREVAANVEFITGAIRTDVQHVSDSVRSLSNRLQDASDVMERRVEEFNALMEVVQSEAEDLFIGSAATARGVRASARAFKGGGRPGTPAEERGAGLDPVIEDGDGPRSPTPEPREASTVAPSAEPKAAPGGVRVRGSGDGEEAGRHSGGG